MRGMNHTADPSFTRNFYAFNVPSFSSENDTIDCIWAKRLGEEYRVTAGTYSMKPGFLWYKDNQATIPNYELAHFPNFEVAVENMETRQGGQWLMRWDGEYFQTNLRQHLTTRKQAELLNLLQQAYDGILPTVPKGYTGWYISRHS